MEQNYIAFEGHDQFAEGSALEVAVKIKQRLVKNENASIILFDNKTGKQIDLDLSGTISEIKKRYAPKVKDSDDDSPRVGRPKLGVISKEVSLLPKHWEWLASQSTSASVTLRRLVEEAQKRNKDVDAVRMSQEACNRFITAMAGDLVGYEDALRALYAREEKTFKSYIHSWPKDIREQAMKYAVGVFANR